MPGPSKKRQSSLMTHGQIITAFIFSNILFLILGMAIGKGDFDSTSLIQEQESKEELVQAEETKQPVEPEMTEFYSLEQTGKEDKKQHIDLTALTTTPKEDNQSQASTPKKKQEEPPAPQKKIHSDPRNQPQQEKTNPTPPSASKDSDYYLQLLASKDKKQAEAFLGKVKAKGYPAKIVHESGFFKVQIGSYATKAKANRMKVDIDKALGVKAWIKKR